MDTVRLRLHEKDRPTHERGDEWFEADRRLSELDEVPWDQLRAIERETDATPAWLQMQRVLFSVSYVRVLLWIARRNAGITEDFAKFKPLVGAHCRGDPDVIEFPDAPEPAGADDVDPPEGTPPVSVDSGQSPKRSTPSTRPSRASTGSRRGKSAS